MLDARSSLLVGGKAKSKDFNNSSCGRLPHDPWHTSPVILVATEFPWNCGRVHGSPATDYISQLVCNSAVPCD